MADHTSGVHIRPVKTEDTGTIIRITGEVFAPSSIDAKIEKMIGLGGADWLAVKAEVIRRELGANPGGCFVAEIGGEVVGYVTTVVNVTASRGTISNVAVLASCQGKSVGRKLINRALEHFREAGLAQAKIETLATNEVGYHLYTAMGFKEVVRQVHFIMPLDAADE